MSSWFSSGLGNALGQLSEQAHKAVESVKESIPVDTENLSNTIAKLTLNTDEMKAERQMFRDEATRRAQVKDMLAGMLPWETKDSERDILVEECKEAILKLSSDESTFFGPYEMPGLAVKLEKEKKKSGSEDGETDDDDDDEEEEEEEERSGKKERKPSEESLEKLAKLEPLPPLLRDFDLDSHVGLIKRLLQEDPQLSHMQSSLSGGGAREKVFWHNYFFHCAFTRYEAGLSIDEIWSFQPDRSEDGDEAAGDTTSPDEQGVVDETVAFSDETGKGDEIPSESGLPVTDNSVEAESNPIPGGDEDNASPSNVSLTNEFEIVDDDDDNVGSGDPELDELEAEIARELED